MKWNAYEYQSFAVRHILDNNFCGLFLEMGLGKTVATLTALDALFFDCLQYEKTLVIAPKKVAETVWQGECGRWDHLKAFRISAILGDERKRKQALQAKADIYVINRENVAWLVALYGQAWPFKYVVIDELSSFKNAKSQRFRALKTVRPLMRRVIGLTGTPTPNDLLDLWPQMYLLDKGERLGTKITEYREKYFTPGARNGHIIFDYKLQKKADEIIYDKIKDICISMKARDFLKLPRRLDITREIIFSKSLLHKYEAFEREEILKINDVDNISVVNAAALTNKLLQFTNGAIYDEFHASHTLHDEKLNTLIEDVEAANGEPVLIFYTYKHDLPRLSRALKSYSPQLLKTPQQLDAWNKKEIPVLFAHPQSAGHGLNMQFGGNIILWFGLPWSSEIYAQAVARLDRQGQIKPVRNNRYIVKNTIDEDVLTALNRKLAGQDALMTAIKARINKYFKKW